MQVWTLDRSKPLGEILVEQGAMSRDMHEVLWHVFQGDSESLEGRLQGHREDLEAGIKQGLPEVSSAPSVEKTLGPEGEGDRPRDRSAGQDLSQAESTATLPPSSDEENEISQIDLWATMAPEPSASGEASGLGTPIAGPRYRILRPHARGGLGEVLVAHDEALNREVAIKAIAGPWADNSEVRARFLREAEITAGLEHPGVVPIYSLGQYRDGRVFYAMRFIRGNSLQDAINRFHRAGPEEWVLALRQLVLQFVYVCNTVAYAHSRGILHRDIKPTNIMVGRFGETLLMDWGLAVPFTLPRAREAVLTEDLPLRLSTGVAEETGHAIGTPSFMSPEQAAGRLDMLGPTTDVYSLGVTLYVLLTGKTPISGPGVAEVLERVRLGEFPRPRRVNRLVPRALETICLKAMALNPQDRYASAAALATDLQHWLADEPVPAWRGAWYERFLHWMRRRPLLVQVVVTVLIITAVLVFLARFAK
jgi:tRNA A-37 threonylcarbamoyl transferase component Bud32